MWFVSSVHHLSPSTSCYSFHSYCYQSTVLVVTFRPRLFNSNFSPSRLQLRHFHSGENPKLTQPNGTLVSVASHSIFVFSITLQSTNHCFYLLINFTLLLKIAVKILCMDFDCFLGFHALGFWKLGTGNVLCRYDACLLRFLESARAD